MTDSSKRKFPGTPIEGPSSENDADKTFDAPASATTGLQDYDLEGEGRKKPGTGASKSKKKKPAAHKPKKPKPKDDDDSDDDDSDDSEDDTDDTDDEDDLEECDKVNNDPKDTTSADSFDTNPNATGYGKGMDITTFDDQQLEKFFNAHSDAFMNDELCKGVYDVAQLGQLITQLKYMADSAAVERQIEGDASTVPEQLRDEAAKLLSVLSAMASEESEEITNGTTMEDVMRDTQPTMTPGLYRRDISEFAKSLRSSLFAVDDDEALAKAGKRNSAKDQETIQKVHDAACELGAGCKGPHDSDGENVNPQETMKMSKVNKGDTVMTEGNKRGAAVSDPKPGLNSTNADDAEDTADNTGAEKPQNDTKKSKKRMDMDEAKKGKKRAADMDDDEDDDMDDDMDDMDDDEDDDKPKAKKKKKAAKFFDADDLAKAVAAGVAAAMQGFMQKGDGTVNVRNMPSLMQVDKSGGMQKFQEVNLDELKKSVQTHPKDLSPETKAMGDNGTATLIKAIHASGSRFMLSPSDIPSN